jgi:hypothetical protein
VELQPVSPSLQAVRTNKLLREATVQGSEVIVAEIRILEARHDKRVNDRAGKLQTNQLLKSGKIEGHDVVADDDLRDGTQLDEL